MQVYFDTDYATIRYDENNGVLIGSVKDRLLSVECREYMHTLLSAMRHFKTCKLVIDNDHTDAAPLDQKCLPGTWLNKLIYTGCHSHAAIVLPGVRWQITLEATINSMVNEMTYSSFQNMESALAWLKAA